MSHIFVLYGMKGFGLFYAGVVSSITNAPPAQS